jgi:hypothetical protein
MFEWVMAGVNVNAVQYFTIDPCLIEEKKVIDH